MPEGLEAELYRRAAETTVGRLIETVTVDERQPFADGLRRELPGRTVVGSRRVGKLVIVDMAAGDDDLLAVGLHFGMTGRLIVDDVAPIESLAYASGRDEPRWDRLVIEFNGGGALRINDPRRWAQFTLEPELDRLGTDLFAIDADELYRRLDRRRSSIKAALLDQALIAGLGNMLVDELLFQVGIDPRRRANELTVADTEMLCEVMRAQLPVMLDRGGSDQGTLTPEVRAVRPPCPHPSCSTPRPLARDRVGGRTTIWCRSHQL